ncbi:MAG: filamentous hemagglutinin N-terminal domain-containing protein [Cyanobacteria bacterium SBLK]|nr:filamentous hemagglutinin N-terminal domain-containing protein [Cyanobacteria bacterium SBLK]
MFRLSTILLLASCLGTLALPARSQLLPDATLGAENSRVLPMDGLRDLIEGGAIRGTNLFHSFQEFNIEAGREVYFANPETIANILTRVTGNNLSQILGTLGVLGDANLWLINPNGIYFGADAKLDIRGSFVATTADSVGLGNTSYFSATDIERSQLLSIEPGALFNHALVAHQGAITNRGNLRIGGNFTLVAENLDLMGEIEAEGDLKLQARETLQIRDRPEHPFIAKAGGELLVQGNENVDIFALNHPESGLFAERDLILKSRNPVLGDIHYYSGGNFRILNPDTNTLADLNSPWDPIIRAAGDVTIANYSGASLHIFAGGSVTITGDINITGPDIFNGLQETVILSDGTIFAIDGKTSPTLDIRAGTTNFDTTGCTGICPILSESAASVADITLAGTINVSGGQLLLSNRYFANTLTGNISVNEIDAQNPSAGGSIAIDSRGDLEVGGEINAAASTGTGGDLRLLSLGDINLNSGSSLRSGGRIAGSITLESNGNIQADNTRILNLNFGNTRGSTGGDVSLQARTIVLENSTTISSSTSGDVNAGGITLNATDTLRIEAASANSVVDIGARGNSGAIAISVTNLELLDGGAINVSTGGSGKGGQVMANISNTMRLQGESRAFGFGSGIYNVIGASATGDGGTISVSATRLEILDGGRIDSNVFGTGNSGETRVSVSDTVLLQGESTQGIGSGIYSVTTSGDTGNGGTIFVDAANLEILDGAAIDASAAGQGNAGNIEINAQTTELDNFASIAVRSTSSLSGSITLQGTNLTLRNNSQIAAETANADGGNITLDLEEVLLLRHHSLINTTAGAAGAGGNGGNITIEAAFVVAVPGEDSDIIANAFNGNGGNIDITANAIYGLEFRDEQTDESDITASSQFGTNGTLVFTSLSFPSEQGLNELSASVVDVENEIGRNACDLQDGRIAGGSSFTITGRGGIPDTPDDALVPSPYVPEWTSYEESPSLVVVQKDKSEENREAIAIRPVQGWHVDADGTVHLTADASTLTPNALTLAHPTCHDFLS